MGSTFYDKRTGTYSVRYRENGRRITKRTGERSQEKAKEWLKKYEKGTLKDVPTLRQLLDEHLDSQREDVRSKTFDRYGFCYRAIMAPGSPLCDLTLDQLNWTHLTEYVKHRREQNAGPATVRKEITWIRSAITTAHLKGYVSTDTLQKIDSGLQKCKPLKIKVPKQKRILYRREMVALETASSQIDDGRDPGQLKGNVGAGWRLALYTGLRFENVLGLRHRHVDRMFKMLRIPGAEMKGGEEHVVYLGPVAMQIIESRLSDKYPDDPDRLLFHDFSSTWKRLITRLRRTGNIGSDHFVFRDLRRTFASYRIAAGIPPGLVQDEMAHASPALTMGLYRQRITDPETLEWAKKHFAWAHGWPASASIEQEAAALVG